MTVGLLAEGLDEDGGCGGCRVEMLICSCVARDWPGFCAEFDDGTETGAAFLEGGGFGWFDDRFAGDDVLWCGEECVDDAEDGLLGDGVEAGLHVYLCKVQRAVRVTELLEAGCEVS